jgi:hypothetical protein
MNFPKPQSSESELVGTWLVSEDRRVRADRVEERIDWLTANYLRMLATSAESGGWDALFHDPEDGRYWELTFPQSHMHGGGPKRLSVISEPEARTKYRLP